MARRMIDLSVAIENDIKSDPPGLEVSIKYLTHKETAPLVAARYEGLKPEDLIDGEGYAIEFLQINTHNGTHVDAPGTTPPRWIAESPQRASTRSRWTGSPAPA